MRTLIASATASTVALIALAGCSTAPATPSLDQQQQAWEAGIETQACESIKRLNPGTLELSWLSEDGNITGSAYRNATERDTAYTCNEDAFDRYLNEWLVEDFPDSPKGQAGETTKPSAP